MPSAAGYASSWDQGGADPWETVRNRLRQVLLRSDLWSDQMIVLRSIQSLTLLDVHHYCELVRELGGYERGETPHLLVPELSDAPIAP